MDSRAALMIFVMVALLMKGAAAAIHTVGLGTVNGWTVPSDKSAYSTWASKNTFYLNDQLYDHCQSGMKLAINVTGGTNPTTTTTPQSPQPSPSSASALTVGTLFAFVSSTIVIALLTS
ncbi:hypothetical protein M0R45_003156 [Rubus argutus]|uniref:Phytocyanin domain-containing protein n=1 Tax=Rubus argutus TaxID=59490 RepID=A0AAW1YE84_RUBAR